MKKLILSCALLGLAACQSTPNAETSQTIDIKREWRLSHFPPFTAQQLQEAQMDWQNLPQASAYMGCNQLNFQAETHDSGSLKVSAVQSTRMSCGEEMALEQAFVRQITQMKRYEVVGNTLILHNDSGTSLRFITK